MVLVAVMPIAIVAQDKLAYVDAQEIFGVMPELSAVESQLATKRESISKTMETIQAEYTKKLEEFQKAQDDKSPESVIQDIGKQIDQIQERYTNFMQSSQVEMQNEQQKLMAPIQQKLMQAIKDVGDENNYTYILDRSALLYMSPSAVNAGNQVKTKLGIAVN